MCGISPSPREAQPCASSRGSPERLLGKQYSRPACFLWAMILSRILWVTRYTAIMTHHKCANSHFSNISILLTRARREYAFFGSRSRLRRPNGTRVGYPLQGEDVLSQNEEAKKHWRRRTWIDVLGNPIVPYDRSEGLPWTDIKPGACTS